MSSPSALPLLIGNFYLSFEQLIISMPFALYRYNRMSAYGQSKLANVLHANELARLLKVTDLYEDIVIT